MRTIEAERIGGHVYRYVKERPRTGRVASLFRHGFNVLFDEETEPGFVSIQTPDVPLHPWAVASELAGRLRVGELAVAEADRIRFREGDVVIDVAAAEVEELRIHPYASEDGERALSRRPILEQLLEEERAKRDPDPFRLAIDAILNRWRETVNPEPLIDLIGLGTGSTPAGDDVLVGLIAGLTALENVAHEAKAALRGLRSAPRETRSQTSLASAQMIAAALDGSFPEPLCDLVAALGREDVDDIEIRGLAELLVALGANSGRAMLRGLIAAVAGPEGP
jgi:hypothetical protein